MQKLKKCILVVMALLQPLTVSWAQAVSSPPVQSCEGSLSGEKAGGENGNGSSKRFISALQKFMAGDKAYGRPVETFALDHATIFDAQLEVWENVLAPYLFTEGGKKRLRWLLRHSMQNASEITQRQNLIKYIADHAEEFQALRDYLTQFRKQQDEFVEYLVNLERDSSSVLQDSVQATLTVGSYFLASLPIFLGADAFGSHTQIIKSGLTAVFSAVAYNNALSRVRPRREALKPLQTQMEALRKAMVALAALPQKLPFADELNETFASVRRPVPGLFRKLLFRINALFDSEDRDLDDPNDNPLKPDKRSLRNLFRRLVKLETVWKTKILGIPISFNPLQKGDFLYYNNFFLRQLRNEVVRRKDELAGLFSALADLEVNMAAADFYNAQRKAGHKMNFIEFFEQGHDDDALPQIYIPEAHHTQLAIENYANSIPHDIGFNSDEFGHSTDFWIVLKNPKRVFTKLQEAVILNQVAAHIGFPTFNGPGRQNPVRLLAYINPQKFGLAEDGPPLFQRWAYFESIMAKYPNVLLILNDPWVAMGDEAAVPFTLGAATVLAGTKSIGLYATASPKAVEVMSQFPDFNILPTDWNEVERKFGGPETMESMHPERSLEACQTARCSDDFLDSVRSGLAEQHNSLLSRIFHFGQGNTSDGAASEQEGTP